MRRRCQSRSAYGKCGLWAGHDGDHAIPIGALGSDHPKEMRQINADTCGGFWFIYPKRGSDQKPSYAFWENGWVTV